MVRQLFERLLASLRAAQETQRSQWVAVSICFVLAVTLWFLVTMNTQSFESTFEVPIKVKNVPANYQLTGEIPDRVLVEARGRGIDLLSEKWESNEDTISIDFQSHFRLNYFIASNHLDVLASGIKYDLRPIKMIPDSIPLAFVPIDHKKVPLVLDLDLDLPLGYRHSGELKADFFDSIMVVGPKEELDKIDSWKTVRYQTPQFKSRSTYRVGLEAQPPLRVEPQNVQVTIDPKLYTETSVEIPIKATNVPTGLKVRFDPPALNVDLLVLLDRYENIERAPIQAIVDFNSIDERSNMVIPEIRRVPSYAELQRFSPVLVNYIIIE